MGVISILDLAIDGWSNKAFNQAQEEVDLKLKPLFTQVYNLTQKDRITVKLLQDYCGCYHGLDIKNTLKRKLKRNEL